MSQIKKEFPSPVDGFKCKDCMFFKPENNGRGICRRYPPQVDPGNEHTSISMLRPEMQEDDMCGEFRSNYIIKDIVNFLNDVLGDIEDDTSN